MGTHLTDLNLASLNQLTSSDLFTLLHNVPQLQVLNVSYITAWHDGHTVHIVRQAPHLRELHLEWCQHVTDVSVTHIANASNLRLECLGLTGTAMSSAGAHCPRLVKLNVARCRAVSDKGLASILANCPALQHVDVAWTLVSNAAVLDMLHLCPELRSLSVQGCKNINRELVHGIAKMPTSLPHFAYLDLSWVDDVMTTDIAAAVSAHPLLTIKGYFGDLYDDSDKYHEH
ncbi:hypothetical protein DYB38_005291 [Aphanomyces astaci]|uniref:F-box/LRR-repeat protein 15-like leucin rich repeat domain-containing protein n=1 Tax=Aphanomyces astaci TaxID=112090 RepID=A0A397CUR0_APHAT|nr:hypothetical protein DYB38_005291 [Aphanomyces astaci]